MKKVMRSIAYAVLTLAIAVTVFAIRSGKATELMEWGEKSVQNALFISLIFVPPWAAAAGFSLLLRKRKK